MSGWTKEQGGPKGCQGCTKRKVGCHDVTKCAEWARQVEERRAAKAAKAEKRAVTARSWEDRKLIGYERD